jgi:uncharacterized protein (DUF433 family)
MAGAVCGGDSLIKFLAMIQDRIEINPKIMMGKPVVKGTRITVENILEKMAGGESAEQILAAHPRLVKEDIYAALRFAAYALKGEIIYPIAA